MVTTLEDAPLREGERFCEELVKRDYHLGALILNKTLPQDLFSRDGAAAAKQFRTDSSPISAALSGVTDTEGAARVLATIGGSFENFAVVAHREQELRRELRHRPEVVVDVPTFADEIADLGGLARIASYLMPS